MQEGGTDIACCGPNISEEEEAKIMAARDKLLKGELQIYAGPLYDQDGNLRAAEGEVIPDPELWQMDWFVDGVITQQ
jgi:hypothetical protein